MIRRLEEFVGSLGMELHMAQEASRQAWPDTRIAMMNIDLSATVERIAGGKALALRIGRARFRKASSHQLTVELSDEIVVRIDGKLLGRYGGIGHGEET